MTAPNDAAGSRTKRQAADIDRRRLAEAEASLAGIDFDEPRPLGREALEVAKAWSVIGLFAFAFFALLQIMGAILIPVTLAVVVGLILGMAADKLGRAGMPRFAIALTLSGLVFAGVFGLANALAEPLAALVRGAPDFIENSLERITPWLESQRWLNLSPTAFFDGQMSAETLIQNSGTVLSMISAGVTPALFQGAIFFGALMFFLYGRLKLRRNIIMAFPQRRQRLVAIRILNSIDEVLGYYFATAGMLYLGLGAVMALIAWVGGLPMPLLWGLCAFITSFIPYLGIAVMTTAVAVGGIISHETLLIGLMPALVFFAANALLENLILPTVMGRQWELNPFIVFVAILFWTWLWGAIGAMLALPLSLIMMTVFAELFPERKPSPNLPG